jgi:hypothetical protein
MSIKPTSAWLTAALALVALALQGCASMNKDECLAVDWRTVGYEDGVAGRAGDRIAEHRKACAKYGVTPDLRAYQSGRSQGLREYCRPQNGYQVGERGGNYAGVCPADLEPSFLGAYEAGRELYNLQSRLYAASNRLSAAHHELERAEHEIVEQSAVIVSSDATSEARAQALVSTKELAEKMGRLKEEIADLERDKARYERDLADYRASRPPGA